MVVSSEMSAVWQAVPKSVYLNFTIYVTVKNLDKNGSTRFLLNIEFSQKVSSTENNYFKMPCKVCI